jgi:hypothetical protein
MSCLSFRILDAQLCVDVGGCYEKVMKIAKDV